MRIATLLVLAFSAFVAVPGAAGQAGQDDRFSDVSLSDVVASPASFDEALVRVRGILGERGHGWCRSRHSEESVMERIQIRYCKV